MKKYKGCLANSKIYNDEQGDYIVVSKDLEGHIYKVYITPLSK